MDQRLVHRAGGLLAAVAVTGGLTWLTDALLLAVAAGACWGVGVAVVLRARRQRPTVGNDDGWTDARWTGLATAFVTLSALLGVPAALPGSSATGFGISVLVLGAGLVAYAAASMTEIERHPEGPVHGADRPGEDGPRRARDVNRAGPRERR